MLNALKGKLRSMLKPKITEALLRCQYMDETVYSLDVNAITRRWLEIGHKRCDEGKAIVSFGEQQTVEQESDEENNNLEQQEATEEVNLEGISKLKLQLWYRLGIVF